MHSGQGDNGNSEQKNSQDQPEHSKALTTTTTATTATSLTTSGRRSISPRALAIEATTCNQAGKELLALSQDLYNLLTTEGPNIARIPEILTRRLSALLPLSQGNDFLSKIQTVVTQLATFGVNPALAFAGAKAVVGAGVSKIDPGKHVLESAVHNAGGPASDAVDLYHACTGLYSLYNTYTELSRLYGSILFCGQRICTSAQELAELTGTDEQLQTLNAAFSEYWNQPGFDFNALLNQTREQLLTVLGPLQSLIGLYESMEPLRVSTYLAVTMRAEPNASSQLDQVTRLLTNACYNTALNSVGAVSKSAGHALGRTLPAIGINAGATAALTACAATVTGMSFPITIAILATCIADSSKRDAFIAYAKSYIVSQTGGETKSDEGIRARVFKQLDALKDRGNALLDPLTANVSPKVNQISAKVNEIMERYKTVVLDASGTVAGDIAENAIRTLIQDSDLAPLLQEKLDSVIYPILDGTLRQTLQIPEEKVFLEKLQNMSGHEAATYQVCGTLIPDMVNFLALPNLVEAQLQATTDNPYICSATGKPLTVKEKTIQAATRVLRASAKENIAATFGIIQAGQAIRSTIQGSVSPSLPPAETESLVNYVTRQTVGRIKDNAAALPLSALGSTGNRELEKGLRIYLVEEGQPEHPAPAIVFSRKKTSALMGLITTDSIEIKSFKISKKISGLATAMESILNDRTQTITMESLESENAELKSRSESSWVSELKNQSESTVQNNTSQATPISSVLLPWDHPLVPLLMEKLHHHQKRFNYVAQNEMQQTTLAVQKQRALDNEAFKKQAAELAKVAQAAKSAGFNEAFFEKFNVIPVIQERYIQLLEALKTADTLPINAAPDDVDKIRHYIKTRLINQNAIVLSHINAASERFNGLKLNGYQMKARLAAVEQAIRDVDNLGWFGSTWFASTVTPEARTHYLALLDIQKHTLEATIAALTEPLKNLENQQYDLVTAYAQENPTKAAVLLAEVLLYKKTFWAWQSWPTALLDLENRLREQLSQNKPAEEEPGVTMHLPQEPVVPTLMFRGVPKLQESKDESVTSKPDSPASPKA